MNEMTLREIFEKAHSESHSQAEYLAKIDQLWEEQEQEDISEREFYHAAFDFIIPMRQEISNGFQVYFTSYFRACHTQFNSLKEEPSFYHLLPTVYLLHHTTELFLKMVKIDSYNMLGFGDKDIEITNLLLPTNIKDLKLASHNANKLFGDDDVIMWFSFIENGDNRLKELAILYESLRSCMEMNNLAEDARFPLRKDTYVYIDRRGMSPEKINECIDIIDKILSILSVSYISWHRQDRVKALNTIMDKIKDKAEDI